jgi:hypothetical protein
MTKFLFANNAQSALAGSISNTSTVINLLPGGGAQFPSPGAGQQFELTLVDIATGLIREIVYVTNRTADTLTVVRGQEGTVAIGWAANSPCAELVTKGQLEAFLQQGDAQSQSGNYGVDTGAVNSYVVSLDPAITSTPPAGTPVRVLIKAGNGNTGPAVLNAGWGPEPIVRDDGSALIGLELVAGQIADFIWTTAGDFQLQAPGPATAAAITAGTDERSYVTPSQLAAALGTQVLVSGQAYFSYVSAAQVKLSPKNGQLVTVAGVLYAVPAAGITAANTSITLNGVGSQNLSASSGYLVALNESLQLEFWTLATGHSPSTTAGNIGTEIITGHNDKTLVGFVYTNSSSEFSDTDGNLNVLSWFNRKLKKSIKTFTGSPTLAADAAPAELSTTMRNNFIVWSGELVNYCNTGSVVAINSAQRAMTGISFDAGATVELNAAVFTGMRTNSEGSATTGSSAFSGVKSGLVEGQHVATLYGATYNYAGNAAVWTGGTTGFTGLSDTPPPNVMTIEVWG